MRPLYRLVVFVFLCMGLTTHAQSTHTHCERSKVNNINTIVSNEFTQNYDVVSYQLAVNLDPDTLFISGTSTIFFTPRKALEQFIFDLQSTLHVDAINGDTIGYKRQNQQIVYTQSFDSGRVYSVEVQYHGVPPMYSTAFVKGTHNDSPILWTLSEPYGASHWWPCKESLKDKADSARLTFTVPTGNKVASNGVLTHTAHTDSTSTFTWETHYPMVTYLFAFAVTNYAEINHTYISGSDTMPILDYVYPEDSAVVYQDLLRTDSLLHHYDTLFRPYPFLDEKYGHAQFSRGGGMEHQTMSFMTHFRYPLMAHELAHQWFGDYITCATWGDLWLNEGFATYFTGVPMEFEPAFGDWEAWRIDRIQHITSQPGGSVFVYDTANVPRLFDSRLTYSKAGYVLHMLRKQMGDAPFFAGIKSYVNDPELAFGTASTADFFAHMQAQTPISLDLFIQEWIYLEGFPSYQLYWQQRANRVTITLRQHTSHPSVPFFHLKVPIMCLDANGQSHMYDLDQTQGTTNFELEVDYEVGEIYIDPHLDLISKGNSVLNQTQLLGFAIYPNPTADILYIQPSATQNNMSAYTIHNTSGQMILQGALQKGLSYYTIDVSRLAPGMYVLEITEGEQRIQERITVVR